MPRPRTVYRGKRKYSWLITLAVMLLLLVIVLAVWLFYYLQRFIVYDKDGLRLDLSAQREEILHPGAADATAPAVTFTPTEVEIVVEQRDYSEIVTSAGSDVQPIRAIYVSAAELSEVNLKYYTSNMGDFDALVLELKDADGFLRWHSGAPQADSFALNGTLELADITATLKEQGVYLAANISALADNAMALRNAPIALKNASTGGVYTERDGQAYLDPYSDGTRDYLRAMIAELKEMGFDEVFLSGFVCPDGDDVRFSLARTQLPTPADALASLGLWLREQADALDIRLSVIVESESLRGETVLRGQDTKLLFRIFDRVTAETDFDHLEGDLSAMERALGGADETRILTITDDYAPERQSYIVK